MSNLSVITDPLDELSRRVSWVLEREFKPQLVVLEQIEQFEGFPPEVEHVIAKDDDQEALIRAFAHGERFLMTPRGGFERILALGTKLHGRIAIFATSAANDELENTARNIGGTVSIARYGPETDLDQAAETLAHLLGGDGVYMSELDLDEPLIL